VEDETFTYGLKDNIMRRILYQFLPWIRTTGKEGERDATDR